MKFEMDKVSGLKLVSLLVMLAGMFIVAAGVGLMLNYESLAGYVPLLTYLEYFGTYIGFGIIAFGLVTLLLGWFLWQGQSMAYYSLWVIATVAIVWNVYTIIVFANYLASLWFTLEVFLWFYFWDVHKHINPEFCGTDMGRLLCRA